MMIIIGVFYYEQNQKNTNNEDVSKQQEDTGEKAIVLYKETGNVFIKNNNDNSTTTVETDSLEIKNLTEVITGTNSSASVILPDNSVISLSENTDIVINYSDKNTAIFQSLGKTYHRVQQLLTGKTYEVRTPTTLAAVRGTKFAVSFDGVKRKTQIAVTEHKVNVYRIKQIEPTASSTATTTIEAPVAVEEGNIANVIEYKKDENKRENHIEVLSIKNDPEISTWVNKNKKIDIKFDELKSNLKNKIDSDTFRKELKDEFKAEKLNIKEEIKNIEKETQINEDLKKIDTPIKTETPTISSTSTKKYLSEEEFSTVFDDFLIKYFYVDDQNVICGIDITPSSKIKQASDLASVNGRTLGLVDSNNLFNLATKIKDYCSRDKNPDDRTKLQQEFENSIPSIQ